MKSTTQINVFIASPADTKAERETLCRLIEEWNSTYGDDDKNVFLKVIKWEKDLAVRSNIKPQDAINEDLLSNCDILTGIFWTKFGSPTNNAESGTLEEIEYFLSKDKPVIMYFLDKPINPSKLNGNDFEKIKQFKNKYQENNIYRETDLSSSDDFRTMFIKDLNRNLKELLKVTSNEIDEKGNIKESGEKWYKSSIKKLIEQSLSDDELPLVYRREISFVENVKLWGASVDIRHPDIIAKISRAREDAFSNKYGEYNYKLDLREKYNSTWYKEITQLLTKEGYHEYFNFEAVGVASNNGLELTQIFKGYREVKITALDLSRVAISKGKTEFKQINFVYGNMEDSTLETAKYNVYLNLRSIHSSGVDIRMTLSECYRLLKPGGLSIISVSNGYLTPNQVRKSELIETKGMYDNRIDTFSTDKPYELANKIRMKMDAYGFNSIEVHTGETEIYIKAKK